LRLPENLALDDIADVARRLGTLTDRTTVARALRDMTIRGVKEPEIPRGRWRIPRAKLHECVGAVLLRREERKPGWRNLDPEVFVWLAAKSMLEDDELEVYVPRRLRAKILEEERLEEERRLRAERRARREKAAAERRARELAERQEFNEVRRQSYWRARVVYLHRFWAKDLDGDREPFDRDWPHKMPSWWMPPPEMRDVMRDFLRRRDATRTFLDFDTEVRGWQEWLPTLAPGQAWPWRRPEADEGDAAPA
jgi:hypothetical protein